MNMRREPLGYLRISRSITMNRMTNLKQSSVVSLFAMVVMQWHLVTQNATLRN